MKRIFVFVCLLIAFYLGMVQEGVRSQAIPRMWAETLLEVSTDEIPWGEERYRTPFGG